MFSGVYTGQRLLAALFLTLFSGCITAQAASSGPAARAAKDCATCERMCELGGDAQNDRNRILACKADCQRNCERN